MKEIFCVNCSKKRKWYATLKSDLCNTCRNKLDRCKCGRLRGPNHQCASVDEKGKRHCEICQKELSNDKTTERYRKLCGKCGKRKWREQEKLERIRLRIRFGGKCAECGYNKCFAALHFHHLDATEKYKWTSKGKGGASLREIKKYPERFKLLCSCCHIETHHPSECYTQQQIEEFSRFED